MKASEPLAKILWIHRHRGQVEAEPLAKCLDRGAEVGVASCSSAVTRSSRAWKLGVSAAANAWWSVLVAPIDLAFGNALNGQYRTRKDTGRQERHCGNTWDDHLD
jgi:hypothetical protein